MNMSAEPELPLKGMRILAVEQMQAMPFGTQPSRSMARDTDPSQQNKSQITGLAPPGRRRKTRT